MLKKYKDIYVNVNIEPAYMYSVKEGWTTIVWIAANEVVTSQINMPLDDVAEAWGVIKEIPRFPVPTDTPLNQDMLPFDDEDGEDYLNRVTQAVLDA